MGGDHQGAALTDNHRTAMEERFGQCSGGQRDEIDNVPRSEDLPRHELLSFASDPVVIRFVAALAALIAAAGAAFAQEAAPFPPPKTEPPIVTPGRTNADPPSDAIVLFNGKDLSQWRSADGSPAKWTVRDGYVEVAAGSGDISTAQQFGDVQLHIEWATPAVVKGEGQERGNSGVFLMGRYEVQVLDSYENKTYYHGQAGAVYKQYA